MSTNFYFRRDLGFGWHTVVQMVDLATRLFDGEFHSLPSCRPNLLKKLRLMALRAPRHDSAVSVFVVRHPGEIALLGYVPEFFSKPQRRVLWIIESHQTTWLPHKRTLDQFDTVVFTQRYDTPFYENLLGKRALWLGSGSDVLALGSAGSDRPIDVQRVGRQPAEWDDDERTRVACESRALRFCGRPPFVQEPEQQQRTLLENHYGRAKYCVAHSNLVSPAVNTHPTKEYITARWTDALAAGSIVAGVPPWSDIDLIDWPGALLPFDRIDLEHNVEALAEAVAAWDPTQPLRNHLHALQRLDWRWRLAQLAEHLDLDPAPLRLELAQLTDRIAALEASLPAPAGPRARKPDAALAIPAAQMA